MYYPPDMDYDCIAICDSLNYLPGIRTDSSCCGHGKRPHRVFFAARQIQDLRPVLNACHGSAWHVEAGWASGSDTIYFMLQGPIGPADMAGGADDFASWVTALSKKDQS